MLRFGSQRGLSVVSALCLLVFVAIYWGSSAGQKGLDGIKNASEANQGARTPRSDPEGLGGDGEGVRHGSTVPAPPTPLVVFVRDQRGRPVVDVEIGLMGLERPKVTDELGQFVVTELTGNMGFQVSSLPPGWLLGGASLERNSETLGLKGLIALVQLGSLAVELDSNGHELTTQYWSQARLRLTPLVMGATPQEPQFFAVKKRVSSVIFAPPGVYTIALLGPLGEVVDTWLGETRVSVLSGLETSCKLMCVPPELVTVRIKDSVSAVPIEGVVLRAEPEPGLVDESRLSPKSNAAGELEVWVSRTTIGRIEAEGYHRSDVLITKGSGASIETVLSPLGLGCELQVQFPAKWSPDVSGWEIASPGGIGRHLDVNVLSAGLVKIMDLESGISDLMFSIGGVDVSARVQIPPGNRHHSLDLRSYRLQAYQVRFSGGSGDAIAGEFKGFVFPHVRSSCSLDVEGETGSGRVLLSRTDRANTLFSGWLELSTMNGRYSIHLDAPGQGAGWENRSQLAARDLGLVAPFRISCCGSGGEQLIGARVEAESHRDGIGMIGEGIANVDGVARVLGLSEGVGLFRLKGNTCDAASLRFDRLNPASPPGSKLIACGADVNLTIVLSRPDGDALPRQVVELRPLVLSSHPRFAWEDGPAQGVSDSNGLVRFGPVAPGEYVARLVRVEGQHESEELELRVEQFFIPADRDEYSVELTVWSHGFTGRPK